MIKNLLASLALAGAVGLQAAHAEDTYLVHGIDGADLGLDSALPVDVTINEECAATNVTFGAFFGPFRLDPGFFVVEVRLADPVPCAGPVVIVTTVTVNLGESNTIVAHLTEYGTLTATTFVNDTRPLAASDARLIVRHTAQAPAVDVYANGGILFGGLENPEQVQAVVPADTYAVDIYEKGAVPGVLGPLDVTLADGTITAVHAVGSVASGTFTVIPVPIAN